MIRSNPAPTEPQALRPGIRRASASISWFAVILAVAGALIVILSSSRYGIGVSPDSVNYIFCARQLAAGEGFQAFNPSGAYTAWPPLYPLLLSLPAFLGWDPMVGARWIHAILYAMLILAAHRLFKQTVKPPALVVAGTILAVFGMQVISFAVMAWSEIIFALMLVLFCNQLNGWALRPSKRALCLAMLWAAMAAMSRYVGVVLIAAGVLIILTLNRDSAKARMKQAALFGVGSGLPIALWMLRNNLLGTGFAGPRSPASASLADAVWGALRVFTLWVAPPIVPFTWRLTLLAAVAGLMGWAAVRSWRKRSATDPEADRQLAVLAVVFGLYVATILGASAVTALDALPYRYLAVVFIPGVCIAFILLSRLIHGEAAVRAGRWMGVGLGGTWTLYFCTSFYVLLQLLLLGGAGGYSTTIWHRSPIVNALKRYPLDGDFYTNGPDALYILNGQTGRISPSLDQAGEVWCRAADRNTRRYLVWLDKVNWRSYLATPRQLSADYTLIPEERFPDGTIYVVVCKKGTD